MPTAYFPTQFLAGQELRTRRLEKLLTEGDLQDEGNGMAEREGFGLSGSL